MSDDSIPLYDGPPTGARILHYEKQVEGSSESADTAAVRTKRREARKHLERVEICLGVQDASGRAEFVDCPVLDISSGGTAVDFDRKVTVGSRCTVSYRTLAYSTVNVGGFIRSCRRIGSGEYRLGIEFDRHLSKEEQRPAHVVPGRAASPLTRSRKLKRANKTDAVEVNIDAAMESGRPLVIEPSSDSGGEIELSD